MKHFKMSGLTAITVLGLMAFIGAGTASATKLCTDSACSVVYPAGTEVDFSLVVGHTMKFTANGEPIDTCTESTIGGKTANEGGTWVRVEIESLTWNKCSVTTDTVALGVLEIERTGTNTGKVVGWGSQVTINIFGTTCTYGTGTGTTLGTLSGGFEPVLSISEVVLIKTAGGFFCGSTIRWDGDYILTSPHAMFIGA